MTLVLYKSKDFYLQEIIDRYISKFIRNQIRIGSSINLTYTSVKTKNDNIIRSPKDNLPELIDCIMDNNYKNFIKLYEYRYSYQLNYFLNYAIKENSFEIIKFLLQQRRIIEISSLSLSCAIENGYFETIKYLVNHAFKIKNILVNWRIGIHNCSFEMIKFLLDNKIIYNERSLLIYACKYFKSNIVTRVDVVKGVYDVYNFQMIFQLYISNDRKTKFGRYFNQSEISDINILKLIHTQLF